MTTNYAVAPWDVNNPHPWGLVSDQTGVVVITAAFADPMCDLAPWWRDRGHTNITQVHQVDGAWHAVGECAGCTQTPEATS